MIPYMRTFRQMLGLISRGDFSKHLDQQMAECIEALEQMPADKGKASMVISIDFNFELGRVDIDAKVKTKLPETVKFMKTPFWVHNGQLSVEHPNQIDMFTRKVDGAVIAEADDGDGDEAVG